MRHSPIVVVLGFLAGCGATGIEGTLVDGMTGDPIPDMRIIAKATDQASMTCGTADGKTDASGKFNIANACISETGYALSTEDKNLWLGESGTVPKDTAGALKIEAWRAGEGEGLFELAGTTLSRVTTGSDVSPRKIYMTAEEVLRPKEMPATNVVIEAGEHLVLSGKDNVEGLKPHPLLPSGPRKFGDENEWVDVGPWWYVGTDFKSDTEFERKTVALDESKTKKKEAGDRAVLYIAHDALPPGRYAFMKAKDRRMFIVDFVTSPELPAVAEVPAEAPPQ